VSELLILMLKLFSVGKAPLAVAEVKLPSQGEMVGVRWISTKMRNWRRRDLEELEGNGEEAGRGHRKMVVERRRARSPESLHGTSHRKVVFLPCHRTRCARS
jgi:hypothetical protein